MKRCLASLPVVVAVVLLIAPAAQAATQSALTCGAHITQSVTLSQDLSCPGTVFIIEENFRAHNPMPITLDLGGHTIIDNDKTVFGPGTVETTTGNVTIQHGRIGGPGINSHGPHPAVYQNLILDGGAISGPDARATIRDNTFINGAHIRTSQTSSTIVHNRFIDGPADRPAMELVEDFATVTDNVITGYSVGIEIRDVLGSANVQRNFVLHAGIGIRIGGIGFDEVPGTVSGNWVAGSTGDGILLGTGSGIPAKNQVAGLVVSKNVAIFNGGDGIHADPVSHRPDLGVLGMAVTLTANVTVGNANLGIDSPGAIPNPDPQRDVSVTDGGGNMGMFNGNPAQCLNVVCH